jgi:hypothetical protein
MILPTTFRRNPEMSWGPGRCRSHWRLQPPCKCTSVSYFSARQAHVSVWTTGCYLPSAARLATASARDGQARGSSRSRYFATSIATSRIILPGSRSAQCNCQGVPDQDHRVQLHQALVLLVSCANLNANNSPSSSTQAQKQGSFASLRHFGEAPKCRVPSRPLKSEPCLKGGVSVN